MNKSSSDYINREDAIKAACEACWDDYFWKYIEEEINAVPSVDVEEARSAENGLVKVNFKTAYTPDETFRDEEVLKKTKRDIVENFDLRDYMVEQDFGENFIQPKIKKVVIAYDGHDGSFVTVVGRCDE